MGRKPKIQCRIERDTDESIRAYRDELDDDISQSEAVRHLLRAGLAAKGHPVAATDGGRVHYVQDSLLERLAAPLTVVGGTLLLVTGLGFLSTAGLLATSGTLTLALVSLGAATVLMLSAAAIITTAALAQLALARPLRALVLPWQAEA
jgi:hypothetical protein